MHLRKIKNEKNHFGAKTAEPAVKARPNETGVVDSQISTGQDEHDQATTAASAVEPLTPPFGEGF